MVVNHNFFFDKYKSNQIWILLMLYLQSSASIEEKHIKDSISFLNNKL